MSELTKAPEKTRAAPAPWIKLATEFGPLLLFFFANARPQLFEPFVAPFLPAAVLAGPNPGVFVATAVLIPAVLVAAAVAYFRTRRIPVMPLVTAVLVCIFGGLTFYFQDERFIKMKPTVLYACFGLALLGGLIFKKPLLPMLLDNAMNLSAKGWSVLTLRWALFFFVLAVANEVVWRTQSNDVWVAFKFPGTAILIFLFTLTQVPLILKHEVKSSDEMR